MNTPTDYPTMSASALRVGDRVLDGFDREAIVTFKNDREGHGDWFQFRLVTVEEGDVLNMNLAKDDVLRLVEIKS